MDKPAANFVDGKLMRRLGIGIIVMGSEIAEVMASMPMPTARPAVDDGGAIAEVMREMKSVRDRLAEVERRVGGELEAMIRSRSGREERGGGRGGGGQGRGGGESRGGRRGGRSGGAGAGRRASIHAGEPVAGHIGKEGGQVIRGGSTTRIL